MVFYRPKSLTVFISPILLFFMFLIVISRGWIWNAFWLLCGLSTFLLLVKILGCYLKIENGNLTVVEYFFRKHVVNINDIEKLQQRYLHAFTRYGSVRIPVFDIFIKNERQKIFTINTRPYSKKQLTAFLHDLKNINAHMIFNQSLVSMS